MSIFVSVILAWSSVWLLFVSVSFLVLSGLMQVCVVWYVHRIFK